MKKQNFDFSNLTIYDPTSVYFNNVTPNCKLINNIIAYFSNSLDICDNKIMSIFKSFGDCLDLVNFDDIRKKVDDEILSLNDVNPLDSIFGMNFQFFNPN